MITATILDDNEITSTLMYRSYSDAVTTDFKCALFECDRNDFIHSYIENLQGNNISDCYYKKGNLEIAYIKTKEYDNVKLMFGLYIFFIILGVLCVIVICVCHKHRPAKKEQETFNMHPVPNNEVEIYPMQGNIAPSGGTPNVNVNDIKVYQIQISDPQSGTIATNTKPLTKTRKKPKPAPKVSIGIFSGRRK